MLEFNYQEIASALNKKQPKRVLVQLPEGLKYQSTDIMATLKEKCPGLEFLLLVEPCFGACDLADEKALKLKADLIVHLGHAQLFEPKTETLFFPLKQAIDLKVLDQLEEELQKAEMQKVGLTAAIQYTPFLKSVGKNLEERGFEVFLGQGSKRIKELGQVLGCNYSSAHAVEKDVDCLVFFGDGLFHPLGIAFATKKKVFAVNPLENEVKDLSQEKDVFLRERFSALSQCANATIFGIIVSTKTGQMNLNQALRLKNLIEQKGKQAVILVADYVFPEYFLGLKVDCLVNTACPRIAIDDAKQFPKLIINPTELEIALNYKKLSDFQVDELP